MYILLKDNIAYEFIPDFNEALPDVPIEARYPADLVADMVHVEDGTEPPQGWVYDPETETFSEPPVPEPVPEPEPVPPEPTAQDDTDAMLVDHEFRLLALELGL